MTESTHTFDTRGLNCPLPIIRTRKVIASLDVGEVLVVTSNDQGSLNDMDAFCAQTGNAMLVSGEVDGDFVFRIRKA